MDQGVLSGANFIVGVLIARNTGKEEYGAYVLAFSIFQFIASIHSALVSNPAMVFIPRKEGDELRGFARAVATISFCLSITAGIAVMLSARLLVEGRQEIGYDALIAMSIALPFGQTYELFRRLSFARLRMGRVIMIDSLYAGTLVVVVATILGHSSWLQEMDPEMGRGSFAFYAIGGAGLSASIVGGLFDRRLFAFTQKKFRDSAVEIWDFAKWGIGNAVISLAGPQVVVLAVSGLAGLDQTARYEASRLLCGPVQVAIFALGNVILVRVSSILRTRSISDARVFAARFLGLGLAVFCVYFLFVYFWFEDLIKLTIGPQYLDEKVSAMVFAVYYLLAWVNAVLASLANGVQKPRITFWSVVTNAVVVVPATMLLVPSYGALGGVLSLVVGQGTAAIVLWAGVARTEREMSIG